MSPSSTSPFQVHNPLVSHKVLSNWVYLISKQHIRHTAELGISPVAMGFSPQPHH